MKSNYNNLANKVAIALILRSINRKDAIEQGAYDGRFKQRVIKNKKKEANKKWSRKNKGLRNEAVAYNDEDK